MGRSSGHPRHSSIPLPSWLCHPGLNQTLPISQPPLRTRPLHTLSHSGLSHPITGPFQTSPFHSSSQQSEASDPHSSLGGCREGAGQRLGPHLFLATSVPRAQSEVTVIASFLDLSNSPSAFGHFHPKSRTTTRERQRKGREEAPQPLAQRKPSQTDEHGKPAHRKWGSNRCAEPHKVTWVSLTLEGATPPSHLPHKAQAGVPLPRDEATVPRKQQPCAVSQQKPGGDA